MPTSRLSTLISAVTFGAALAASPAHAARSTPRYTSLTVFGDSLVDAGNYFTLSGGTYPDAASGYFDGRNTNGYDWTDLLSQQLFSKPTTPSLLGGSNWGVGGAHVLDTGGNDLPEQLQLYTASLAHTGTAPDPNRLFVMNFGGNDIFGAESGQIGSYPTVDAYLRAAAQDYADGVQSLNDLGARNILLTGFPVSNVSYSYTADAYLATDLAALHLAGGTSLFDYDYTGFFNRVGTDPASLGLPVLDTDPSHNCIAENAQADGCAGLFYFDGEHPTAAVQAAIFRDIDSEFGLTATNAIPEPANWALMFMGLCAFAFPWSVRRSARRSAVPDTSLLARHRWIHATGARRFRREETW